jgi:hypothetical protein
MGVKYVLVDPWFRQQIIAELPRWLTADLQQVWENGATAVYKRSGAR